VIAGAAKENGTAALRLLKPIGTVAIEVPMSVPVNDPARAVSASW